MINWVFNIRVLSAWIEAIASESLMKSMSYVISMIKSINLPSKTQKTKSTQSSKIFKLLTN